MVPYPGAPRSRGITTSNFTTYGSVRPSRITLAPGAGTTVQVSAPLPKQPGDVSCDGISARAVSGTEEGHARRGGQLDRGGIRGLEGEGPAAGRGIPAVDLESRLVGPGGQVRLERGHLAVRRGQDTLDADVRVGVEGDPEAEVLSPGRDIQVVDVALRRRHPAVAAGDHTLERGGFRHELISLPGKYTVH